MSPKHSFGRGTKIKMTFKEFITKIKNGDNSIYLSAQQQKIDKNGLPELFSPPVSLLKNDFGYTPDIMGNLIPQQINLWLGCAPPEGMHHS